MLEMKDVWEGTKGLLVAGSGPSGTTFRGVSLDSRETTAGDLFFAVRGEREDGHDFITLALGEGATGVVCERPVPAPDGTATFHVTDSLSALQRLGAYWRRRHDIRVIAVTGSVGKTTCKEIITAVLSCRYNTLKSEGNLNTEIGIPLTLLRLDAEHERVVLEFAMYAQGDIDLLCNLAAPQVGVVTNIGAVHLERLGSMGAIAAAKAELVEALPAGGLAVLNADDARTAALAARTRAQTILFGQTRQADVRASDIASRGLDGISFRVTYGRESAQVSCPLPGKHHVYPALAATAVALNEGMQLPEIADALAEVRSALRMRILPGLNGSTILDDSYNASPPSMRAALELLSELPGRRLALLGEMRELGEAEAEGCRQVGRHAAGSCDALLVVGERAFPIAAAARAGGLPDVRMFEANEAATEALKQELQEADHLLVKGSRAVGLESVVEALAMK